MALKLKKTTPAPKPPKATKPKGVADLASTAPITVNPLVKETQAAIILGVSKALLQRDRWNAKKEGIPPKVPFIKMIGGAIRYHVDDLQAVIDAGRVGG